jgi:hypothetical protein
LLSPSGGPSSDPTATPLADPTVNLYSKGGEAIASTDDAVDEDDDSLACGKFYLQCVNLLRCFILSHWKQPM